MLTEKDVVRILNTPETKKEFSKWGITHLSLFGSVGDWTATTESDIDLLYEQHPSVELGWEIVDIIAYISEKLNAPIDLVEKNSLNERLKAKILYSAKKIF